MATKIPTGKIPQPLYPAKSKDKKITEVPKRGLPGVEERSYKNPGNKSGGNRQAPA